MTAEQPAAFDTVAATYDRDFTDTAIGRMLRELVWEQLAERFGAGDRVLELGCGTGEDAVWMAQRGIEVLATDVSEVMLEHAEVKARAAGVLGRLEFRQLDLGNTTQWDRPDGAPIDGVLSNFGALNCLSDRCSLAQTLAGWVRPGGIVVLVVMGRLCAWEIVWFMLRMRPRRAFRRFAQGREAGIGGGHSVPVWYPGPGQVRGEFGPGFKHLCTRAVGALVPTPDLTPLLGHRPYLLRGLASLERPLAPALALLADHYFICFERRRNE